MSQHPAPADVACLPPCPFRWQSGWNPHRCTPVASLIAVVHSLVPAFRGQPTTRTWQMRPSAPIPTACPNDQMPLTQLGLASGRAPTVKLHAKRAKQFQIALLRAVVCPKSQTLCADSASGTQISCSKAQTFRPRDDIGGRAATSTDWDARCVHLKGQVFTVADDTPTTSLTVKPRPVAVNYDWRQTHSRPQPTRWGTHPLPR